MIAKGKTGVVPAKDKHGLGGLVIANTVQPATIHKLRPPAFGHLTTLHLVRESVVVRKFFRVEVLCDGQQFIWSCKFFAVGEAV